ncbi:MAG: hypothetical protein AUG51_11050 [Acidobacteria bacterium 13_1_20CM_3_53_8]|nr:MAG: hypothetical protein AUG51_11050 [Acidobacteria bacterium 13_1_20CM_3_53_8]
MGVEDVKKSSTKSAKRSNERPIFSSIRKPLAPPGHPLAQAKPEERVHPSGRKAKHKGRLKPADEE